MATTLKLYERTITTLTLEFTYSGLSSNQVRVQYYPVDNLDNSENIYINVEVESQVTTQFTLEGLKSGTTYNVVIYQPDAYGEYSDVIIDDEFTTLSNTTETETEEINGFTITKDVTSSTAIITIQSHPGGDGVGYPYDLFRIHPDTGEPIWVDGGETVWEVHPNTAFSYSFYDLEANTKYQLSTNIPELYDIEFITANVGGIPNLSLSYDSLTDSSIRAVLSEDPSSYYDFWTWHIQKVGETTILDWETETSSRTYRFRNLEGDTRYYIWVELEEVESETLDILGMYVTTLPTEGLFYWTYSGIKKNDDGTYEHVLGSTKGVGADYFFITATEWNEYVTKLCEVKDSEGITDFTNDGTLDGLKVEPEQPFTATLYNMVLDILWNMEGNEGWTPDSERANPDNSITPSHLNGIKDRLNALM